MKIIKHLKINYFSPYPKYFFWQISQIAELLYSNFAFKVENSVAFCLQMTQVLFALAMVHA
jgi:hypothetical protein